MIKVHTADGRTWTFDPASAIDAERLVAMQLDPAFGAQVTAVTVLRDGVAYTVARPGDGPVRVEAEASDRGERVRIYSGDLVLGMMAHARHRAARFTVERGRMVWRPGG